MKTRICVGLMLTIASLSACNNGSGTDHQLDNKDTNYSDSRRNAPITENTITGDSTATKDSLRSFDSAQHRGREGNQ